MWNKFHNTTILQPILSDFINKKSYTLFAEGWPDEICMQTIATKLYKTAGIIVYAFLVPQMLLESLVLTQIKGCLLITRHSIHYMEDKNPNNQTT